MTHYYLDTSALVKGYVSEPGSQWVRSLLANPTHVLFISQLTIVETSAAIAILIRIGRLSKRQGERAYDEFKADVTHRLYHVILASERMTEAAARLAQIHPLKAYDAVQLATAIHSVENPFDYAHLDT